MASATERRFKCRNAIQVHSGMDTGFRMGGSGGGGNPGYC